MSNDSAKEKFKHFIFKLKKHSELIVVSLVVFLLFLTCFFEEIVPFVLIFCILSSTFLNFEKTLQLILFLLPFRSILTLNNSSLIFRFSVIVIIFGMGVKYLIELFKKNKKVNLKTFIPISIFLIFIVLPIHKVKLSNFVYIAGILILLYLIFEYKNELSLKKLIYSIFYGLIISSLFYLTNFISSRVEGNELINAISGFNTPRFAGLYEHPNIIGMRVLLLLIGLFVLRYKEEINNGQFIVMSIISFIIGYLTISRIFILCFVILLIIFSILYVVKKRKKGLILCANIFMAVLAVSVVLYKQSIIYLSRANILPDSVIVRLFDECAEKETNQDYGDLEYGSDEWYQACINGEIYFDFGRSGFRKEYLKNWGKDIQTMLFGRGVGAKEIGQMNAHDWFIETLWKHGIVGSILILLILLSFINYKKITKFSFAIFVLIVLPVIINCMFESVEYYYEITVMIMLILGCKNDCRQELDLSGVNKNTITITN